MDANPRRHADRLTPAEAEERFRRLHAETYGKLMAYARRRTPSPADAEDLVAATLLVAWRRLEDVLAADEPLAWLYGVAHRTLANQRRSRARAQALVDRIEEQAPRPVGDVEDEVAERDELRTVRRALATLHPRDQEVLRLAAFEDLTPAAIGAVLGMSAPHVRTVLYRARQRLRRALAEEPAG